VTISRRSVLQGAVLAAATISTRAHGELAVPPTALLVFDSRLPQSRALELDHAGRSIDLAHEYANLWRDLRRLRASGRVVGLTRWSDLVQVRALLEERGRRLRAEVRCGRLFYWEMV
jgi:hypothetical protein